MKEQFNKDLVAARHAEGLVHKYFSLLDKEHNFINVAEDPEYFYKGDVLATDNSGNRIFIEVKDDKRIADTGNILCEENVYYHSSDYLGRGNMQSDCDIYCVVSQPESKIYVFDFKKLKEYYKVLGVYKEIPHADQTTQCYLLPLWVAKKHDILIGTIDYSGEAPVGSKYSYFADQLEKKTKRAIENKKWLEYVSQFKDGDWLH